MYLVCHCRRCTVTLRVFVCVLAGVRGVEEEVVEEVVPLRMVWGKKALVEMGSSGGEGRRCQAYGM